MDVDTRPSFINSLGSRTAIELCPYLTTYHNGPSQHTDRPIRQTATDPIRGTTTTQILIDRVLPCPVLLLLPPSIPLSGDNNNNNNIME